MKKHFPDIPDELWCLGKAVETARQRVYEADEGDTEDLAEIDALWSVIWERITGRDLSGCSNCKEDKGELIVGVPRTDGPTEMTVEEANNDPSLHKDFKEQWIAYHLNDSNFTAEMLYVGHNSEIRQGPLEVTIKKVYYTDKAPIYFLYWQDVDAVERHLEYGTFTALLHEWEPVWRKGMFGDKE